MTSRSQADLMFFLGGRDLEMVTIKELLMNFAPDRIQDKQLAWGAKASDYWNEIKSCLASGKTAVLVELDNDLGLEEECIVIVDHHGERAGAYQPTSLHQVFALLDLPAEQWTRWYELVAANDRGYIPAMRELGATADEVGEVRRQDRAAQGVTPAEEVAAEEAIEKAESLAGGGLIVVHLPHAHTAPVTDRLEFAAGERGTQNILIISPTQVNFSGNGELIKNLVAEFPGGWYGGALPARGFWGSESAVADEVLKCILPRLQTK